MVKENIIPIENLAKVEEVREIPTYQPKYTDEEVAKLKEQFIAEQKEEIKKYQIKGSPLSPEARSRVVRKWGSDYQSSRINGEDIALMQMYGPGFWDDFVKPLASITLVVASVFPPTAAVAAPIALGAAGTGAVVAGLGHVTDDEAVKKLGKDLLEIGYNAHEGQGSVSSHDAPIKQYIGSMSKK